MRSPLLALAESVVDPHAHFMVERFGRTLLRPPWGLHERTIEEHYLIHCLAGEADVIAGSISAMLTPGGTLFVPAGMAHSVQLRSARMTMYHLRFTFSRQRGVRAAKATASPRLPPALFARSGELRSLLDAAYLAYRRDTEETFFQVRALVAVVLSSLSDEKLCETPGLATRQQDTIAEFVTAQLPAMIHPSELARICRLSHDYFTRRFRKTYGCAPRTWLLHERLRHAAEDLLGSQDSIGAVSERWGFASPFTFSRQFAAHFGLSPARYRQRMQ